MTAPIEHLQFRGVLKGHNGWVTAIVAAKPIVDPNDPNADVPDVIISASRDKSLILWTLTPQGQDNSFGYPKKRLLGHEHFVQDATLSNDGQHAISASWDGTLRLWDLKTGKTNTRFIGHTKDVLSVAFSHDNRFIVSGSRDRTIKLWNTLGTCKFTFTDKGHKDWVSCVRFSPSNERPSLISAGWDKVVKVWDVAHLTLAADFLGHTDYINTVTVSPDGSLCASGGKDGIAFLWDLSENKILHKLACNDVINALVFSPTRFWLCAATSSCIRIWDLESKVCLDQLKPDLGDAVPGKKALPVQCISLCWSSDGSTLYAGYTDHVIRVYRVSG